MVNSNNQLLQQTVSLSYIEKQLINRLQRDLPLVANPFQVIAEELGRTEDEVISILKDLQKRRVLTRFGPLFDITKRQGAVSLCALKVPYERVDEVSNLVNSYSQVAHNYLREHEWNMWFVLATDTQSELDRTFNDIVAKSCCPGMDCPKQKEFFVGLFLPV